MGADGRRDLEDGAVTRPPWVEGMLRLQLAREAIASISLSHPGSCTCDVCRAAQGDSDALVRVLGEMDRR